MGRCTTATRRWPRDQKSKPEVNSRDVIKWRSEAYVRRSQWLYQVFGPNLVHNTNNTTNTPEWPNSHKLKIQDGGGRHLEFRKKVNNFTLDKGILPQIIWEDAQRRRGDDHMTKSRNRKLIRVTSSNTCLKHMCVDLSDYNICLNQIWYRTQIPHYHSPEWPNSHKLKIQDGGSRRLQFQRDVNNCGLDTYIYTKFYGKMNHGHAEMTTFKAGGWQI